MCQWHLMIISKQSSRTKERGAENTTFCFMIDFWSIFSLILYNNYKVYIPVKKIYIVYIPLMPGVIICYIQSNLYYSWFCPWRREVPSLVMSPRVPLYVSHNSHMILLILLPSSWVAGIYDGHIHALQVLCVHLNCQYTPVTTIYINGLVVYILYHHP